MHLEMVSYILFKEENFNKNQWQNHFFLILMYDICK